MALETQRQRISPNDLPHFRYFSQTIHLPFREAALKTAGEELATFVHEYTHLLQATTTVVGVYNFRGLARRISEMLSALSFRPDLARPIEDWSAADRQLERAKSFLDFEHHFRFNFAMAMGSWVPRDANTASELQHHELELTIQGKTFKRWHVARKLQDRLLWIPLMPFALGEGQAEAYAQRITRHPSGIWAGIGTEPDRDQLIYTTVPALVRHHCPNLPLDETVAFLVDFAMMSFRPDSAFLQALGWLKKELGASHLSGSPDWNDLRRRVDGDFAAHSSSIDRIEQDIAEATEIYSNREDEVSRMILFRLEQSALAMRARREEPGVFLPMGAIGQQTLDRLQRIIPVPRAEFLDGFHSVGAVRTQHLSSQSMLSSASHLLRVVCEGEDARCPFSDGPCERPRTMECATSPWLRGDVGGGRLCEYGHVGGLLGFHYVGDLGRFKAELLALAYERWQARGEPMGDHLADWFAVREDLGVPKDFFV